MITYNVVVRVTGPDLPGHFDALIDAYADLEQADPILLDCSFSSTDCGEFAIFEVDLTLALDDEDDALAKGSSAVRTAIHASGGSTPDWGEKGHGTVYRVTEEHVETIDA